MASPQLENGYTKIANELLDALCRVHLSGNEWAYIHALIRKTYGFNKKQDWVTNTQIASITGLHRVRVSEAKTKLLEKGIITENNNQISLVKNYEEWTLLRKSVTSKSTKVVTEKRNTVTEKRNKVLRKSVPTKEIKETIQKTTSNTGLQDTMSMQNLIPEVIKLFEPIDPKNKNYYANKTQRSACQFLLEEYGFEEIKKRVEVLPKTNTMQFFPTITTPCQLRDKWVQLENQIQRYRQEKQSINNHIAF